MLRISTRTYSRVHGVRGGARSHLLALALLLCRIHDPRACGEFDRLLLARRVFGETSVEVSASRVAETVKHWGFSDQLNGFRQLTALCEVLLANPQDPVSEAEMEFMTAVRTLQDQELLAESKDLCLQSSASSETISDREK